MPTLRRITVTPVSSSTRQIPTYGVTTSIENPRTPPFSLSDSDNDNYDTDSHDATSTTSTTTSSPPSISLQLPSIQPDSFPVLTGYICEFPGSLRYALNEPPIDSDEVMFFDMWVGGRQAMKWRCGPLEEYRGEMRYGLSRDEGKEDKEEEKEKGDEEKKNKEEKKGVDDNSGIATTIATTTATATGGNGDGDATEASKTAADTAAAAGGKAKMEEAPSLDATAAAAAAKPVAKVSRKLSEIIEIKLYRAQKMLDLADSPLYSGYYDPRYFMIDRPPRPYAVFRFICRSQSELEKLGIKWKYEKGYQDPEPEPESESEQDERFFGSRKRSDSREWSNILVFRGKARLDEPKATATATAPAAAAAAAAADTSEQKSISDSMELVSKMEQCSISESPEIVAQSDTRRSSESPEILSKSDESILGREENPRREFVPDWL
ncbi:hypothetical protein AJ79_00763 [Helicocarpus griseus UAMH5409]|uniref:Uncharacterized protein n=1 Tax=Helicocarpus griseus UAMH5409 TaxID=1447875 RepID=A0A2B7Y226_9EURO|nr:hypothetical protein AJ79_00763 [Helicocarpus griseus UAMH5409]